MFGHPRANSIEPWRRLAHNVGYAFVGVFAVLSLIAVLTYLKSVLP
jgi:hypothetical protein